jgi:hypothetical protein
MAHPTSTYFEQLTNLVRQTLERISLNRLDVNPERAIWEMHGSWKEFAIRLKEIFTSAGECMRIMSFIRTPSCCGLIIIPISAHCG